MKSIKTKLMISFAGLILLSTLVVGIVSLLSAQASMKSAADESLTSLAEEDALLTQSRMETQIRTLEMIASNATMQSMDWNTQKSYLESQIENTDFLTLAVVGMDGMASYIDDTTADLSTRDYIAKALKGEANISDVIISTVTNEPVIMVAVPIYKNQNVVGALIGRRDGNSLSDIVKDTGYGKNGYGYLINRSGVVIAHPDKEKVLNQFSPITEAATDPSLNSLAALFTTVINSDSGISAYTYGGKNMFASYNAVEGTNWILILTAEKSEVLAASYDLQNRVLIAIFISLILCIIIAYLIGNSITKPIIISVNQAKKISELDITGNIDAKYQNKKDEIGTLSRALQGITDSIREIVGEITHSSEHLAQASEELTATSEQTASTSEEVAHTIMEIAKGASDQAQYTQDGSEKANRLGEVIEKDQTFLEEMNAASMDVRNVVDTGMKDIEYLSIKTEENNQAGREIHAVIIKTDESSQKIGQASGVIASIAEQTNLLALNAAIEAARAGEAGRGFSVVAEEIRRLAEQSAASTKEIDNTVNELLTNSKEAVRTISNMISVINEQAESVKRNKENYIAIKEAIQNTLNTVEHLNGSGKEMQKMKNEIMDTLQNLSAIAEENSASTQEVTASMEEQTASVEEVAYSSEELAKLAENLQTIISKFKI